MAEALRLLFEWTDGAIHLRSAHRVAKRAPTGSPPEFQAEAEHGIGLFLELRDGERTLYHRQVGPMFPDSHEVQTGDPERPFARVPRRKPYTVEILVPVPEGAGRIVLTERRVDPRAERGTPPRVIVHVDEVLKRDDREPPVKGRQ